MKRKVLVIGAGSGGLLTLCQMCSSLPHEWEVHSVHDPKIPILGVGEATSTNAPFHLFKGTDFILERDAYYLDATYKYAVKYTNWREHTFDSVIIPPGHAMHFDNTRLKEFVFMRLSERYPERFFIHEGTVEYFKNINNGAEVKIDGTIETYDYIIDCSGFPKDYAGYTMVDLPINHALVTPIHKPGDWNYTHHWAHKHGWMFGIPLQHRQGWGYLYNDQITSKEAAMEDMCEILKIDPAEQKFREYTFKPYYTIKGLVNGRLLKNGNQFMFFEPMEALSMEYYTNLNQRYVSLMQGKETKQELEKQTQWSVSSLIFFYRFIYHGGSIYNTEFWRVTKEKCTAYLNNDSEFQEMVRYWRERSYDPNLSTELNLAPFRAYTWEQFNKNLSYNYFVKPSTPPGKIAKVQIPGLLFG